MSILPLIKNAKEKARFFSGSPGTVGLFFLSHTDTLHETHLHISFRL